jgi:hypothetical protein
MARKKKQLKAGRPKQRSLRAQYFTPPLDLKTTQGYPKTPSRYGMLWIKTVVERYNLVIPKDEVKEMTGVGTRAQTDILTSKEPKTCHNKPDSGLDLRGRKKALTRSDTRAMSDYICDTSVPQDNRAAPWLIIGEEVRVKLLQTYYFKPPGMRTVTPQTIQRAIKEDKGIKNFVREEEKLLSIIEARRRRNWSIEQLKKRPYYVNWYDTAFCDEFHFGLGPTIKKKIKRKIGKKARYIDENVYRKEITSKDVKVKAREDGHLELLYVFCVISRDWNIVVLYIVPLNDNGKMNTSVYTQYIFPQIVP